MSAPDTNELFARLQRGDREALGELLCAHADRLRRMIQVRLHPKLLGRVDPDDILQESYLAAAQRIEHFRGDTATAFFVWLRAVTQQTLVDATRHHLLTKKRSAGAEVSLETRGGSTHSTASLGQRLPGDITTPTRAAVRAEFAEQLELTMARLSERDREILLLRHFEELTNNEAAAVLGIHKATSTNRYLRALRRLEAALSRPAARQ